MNPSGPAVKRGERFGSNGRSKSITVGSLDPQHRVDERHVTPAFADEGCAAQTIRLTSGHEIIVSCEKDDRREISGVQHLSPQFQPRHAAIQVHVQHDAAKSALQR